MKGGDDDVDDVDDDSKKEREADNLEGDDDNDGDGDDGDDGDLQNLGPWADGGESANKLCQHLAHQNGGGCWPLL